MKTKAPNQTQTPKESSPKSSSRRKKDQILHLSTIENTKNQLTKTLNPSEIPEIPHDFISTDHLLRPSFSFIHTIIKVYNQKFSFAKTLYDDERHILTTDDPQSLSRQEKIKFLFKIFLCVSLLMKERIDIFVSPAKVLSGQDVHLTLIFLQCLAKAVETISLDMSMKVANEIVKKKNNEGVNVAYKKSIKTRCMIVRIQAIYRGSVIRGKKLLSYQVVKRSSKSSSSSSSSSSNRKKQDEVSRHDQSCSTVPLEGVKKDGSTTESTKAPNEADVSKEGKKLKHNIERNKSEQTASSHKVNDEGINMKKKTTKQQNQKTDLKGQTKERSSSDDNHQDSKGGKTKLKEKKKLVSKKDKETSQPLATIQETKVVKKFKIVNGIKTKQEIEIIQHVEQEECLDESKEKKTEEEEVSALLAQLKAKMSNLKKREFQLNEKIEATRQKEEHLKMTESRVNKLADSLRNKQERLAQERIHQVMEMDKLRLEASEAFNRTKFGRNECFDSTDSDNEDKYESLWKRACDNPTITDLRLKLEAKERAMKKRQDRMVKMEKELVKRMEEVKEEKKQIDDEKKVINESKKKHANRKKRRPLKHNREEIVKSPPTRKLQKKDETDTDDRMAGDRNSALTTSLLQQLAQVSSERGLMQKQKSFVKGKSKQVQQQPINNSHHQTHPLLNESGQSRPNIKLSPGRRKSRGHTMAICDTANNESSSDEIPKSLVRYTTHYHKIGKQINNDFR